MTNETINVDPNEIAKFSQIADKWWDKTGEFKPLHDINPLRLDYIDQHAQLAGKTVLDVGCGGGILSESMARRGAASVLGVDMAEQSLNTAQAHADAERVDNIAYRCVSVEDLAAEMPQSFDVVTCMEMLEHVADPAAILRDIHTLLRPGGLVFLSTVNRTLPARLGAICAAEYLLNLVPQGTHQYDRFIRPAELTRMVRRAGLTPLAISGMDYLPFSRSARLSRQTAINYLMVARKDAA